MSIFRTKTQKEITTNSWGKWSALWISTTIPLRRRCSRTARKLWALLLALLRICRTARETAHRKTRQRRTTSRPASYRTGCAATTSLTMCSSRSGWNASYNPRKRQKCLRPPPTPSKKRTTSADGPRSHFTQRTDAISFRIRPLRSWHLSRDTYDSSYPSSITININTFCLSDNELVCAPTIFLLKLAWFSNGYIINYRRKCRLSLSSP